ncbi:MAG: tetratricopeptide repeat protein [Duncaniella sp.]|nr:tetratricopeptide repeat protein [Duncaniella sp.]
MPSPTRVISSLIILLTAIPLSLSGQINTDQVLRIGQNSLYFEDYILSIQYFNRVIEVKPYLAKPYFLRAVAKLNLDDYLGAETDASLAIERNPFIVDAWEVRGVARQNLGKNREAIDDYTQALSMLPDSRGLLYNKAIAQQEIGLIQEADSTFSLLIKRFPAFDAAYIGHARLKLEMNDTIAARADIDKALQINHNAVNAYVIRADIAINSEQDYLSALDDMDKAIRLQPHFAGFFINRAFLRYMTDDFQGAFADYDYALQLEPENTLALFNRGLLRSEVHDTDKALADFNRVLQLNPDDYKTLYNRALIQLETGRLDNAIADIDRLIEAFPDFAAAYFLRSDALRTKGDIRGAERDYRKSISLAQTPLNIDSNGRYSPFADSTQNTDSTGTQSTAISQEQVKKRFRSLSTIADNSQPEQIFNSKEIRGKIQDRNVTIELEPIFAITYYTSPTELKMNGDYLKEVDEINATRALRFILQVTNHEPSTTDEDTARRHFENIAYYNSYLAGHTPRAIDYLGRAMDFMTLRDYENAIPDLSRAIDITPDFTLAYLIRANARFLQAHTLPDPSLDIKLALADLDKVIQLSPLMPIAHYNKGVVLASEGNFTSALLALTRAIELKPDFGEAYYNRGYVYLTLGNRDAAFADLSKAGSLGIVPSYNLLKRMSAK